MPTKQQVQIVIDNFEKVLPLANKMNSLDMTEGRVKSEIHKCGSIHCHGGWYAVSTYDLSKEHIRYLAGANIMANDLGFDDYVDLKIWADTNPDIWGNKHGIEMFLNKEAFISSNRPFGAQTLQDIINHWKEVQTRLPE